MNREQRVKGGLAVAAGLKPFAASEKKVTFGERAPRKLLASIEDAVRACGLKDGMTVSFHHGFQGGDQNRATRAHPSTLCADTKIRIGGLKRPRSQEGI